MVGLQRSLFACFKMKNADLHTHSYYSDGQISPRDLVRLAKKRRIKNLSLTDHNSVKGVSGV
jgi:predicted metal-dependent phosphoesterase TrpH